MVVAANKSDLGHGDAATKVEKQCYQFLFLVYLMYSLVSNTGCERGDDCKSTKVLETRAPGSNLVKLSSRVSTFEK